MQRSLRKVLGIIAVVRQRPRILRWRIGPACFASYCNDGSPGAR